MKYFVVKRDKRTKTDSPHKSKSLRIVLVLDEVAATQEKI
jgi:hypothetical protein